jgi:putative phage-type endonuclease
MGRGDRGAPRQTVTRLESSIGGSDAAAAAGLSPWMSPIELYQRLVGLVPPSVEETERMKWGKLLEHPIRQWYVERTGQSVDVPPESLFHGEHPWRRATPDGMVVAPRSGRWLKGLEIKNAAPLSPDEWGPEGTDQVPTHYAIQVTWSMHVTDLDEWDLAVLLSGHTFRIYTFKRDLSFEAELVDAVDRFWRDHVCTATPPPPDHTRAFRTYLERLYPDARGDLIPAMPEDDELVARILARRAQIKELERADGLDCNLLCARIGEAVGMQTALGKVHWKPQRARSIVDWPGLAYRLAEQLGMSKATLIELADANHTRQGKAPRPLRLPRVAGSTEEESDG